MKTERHSSRSTLSAQCQFVTIENICSLLIYTPHFLLTKSKSFELKKMTDAKDVLDEAVPIGARLRDCCSNINANVNQGERRWRVVCYGPQHDGVVAATSLFGLASLSLHLHARAHTNAIE
jgi:hypothetical protein